MSEKYTVKNRSASVVVYSIPEDGIRREFAPGEEKIIGRAELDKLTYQAGGRELMTNFLQIKNVGVREELGIHTEPEYDYSEEQIMELILNGSQDAFLDCLDFAPTGIIDLIKEMSIMLPMTDTRKIEALRNKTGFDVEVALKNKAAEAKEDEVPAAEAPTRRVVSSTGRRTAPLTETASVEETATATEATPAEKPKYKVVSEKK